jgi:hypothetical protein
VKKELYDVQRAHAEVLATALETHRSAIDASSTGCGKTLVAAELAAISQNPTLVVCLKQSIPMWKTEMKERGHPAIGYINYEMLRTGKLPWGGWRNDIWQWNLPKDCTIIWDEIQKCQGLATLNSKMLIAAKPYYNLLLSATAAKDPSEMRSTGYILGLHQLRNFWQWAKDHGCTPNQWGKLDFYDDADMRERILLKLHRELFPAHGSRLTTWDLREHFQETQIITTPLDFGTEVENIYAEMEAEIAVLETRMADDSTNPRAAALVAQLRARQKVELLKVPYMREMALDLIAEGRHVVLFFNFDESINAFKTRFPKGLGIIRGGQGKKARQKAMDDFQNDLIPCLACNIQAGGVSLNLHDVTGKHPRASILSPGFNPKDIIQALGRIHRAGGMTPTQQFVLFAAGTVEVKVQKATLVGMRQIDLLNDGEISDSACTNEPIILTS